MGNILSNFLIKQKKHRLEQLMRQKKPNLESIRQNLGSREELKLKRVFHMTRHDEPPVQKPILKQLFVRQLVARPASVNPMPTMYSIKPIKNTIILHQNHKIFR